jgi:vitamin B12 transporter
VVSTTGQPLGPHGPGKAPPEDDPRARRPAAPAPNEDLRGETGALAILSTIIIGALAFRAGDASPGSDPRSAETSARSHPETPAASRAPADVEADDEPTPYRTVVRERRDDDGLEAQRRLDARSPGFATAVDLEQEQGARPSDGLAEIVARTPGASVRSIGGLGQFSSVSVRGSAPQQVQLFFDGVPVGGSLAGLSNLDDLPLDGLTRLEIYRGHVPVAFGGATLGGAIDLVSAPGRDAVTRVAGGVGSFGARQTRFDLVRPLRGRNAHLSTRFGYAGAQGDFPYFDDGGTPHNPLDDTTRRRVNNHYDRVQGQLRLDAHRGRWRFGLHEIVQYKEQGIAGSARAPTRAMNLDTGGARTIFTARRSELGRPGGNVEWVSGFAVDVRRFTDPLAEIGIADDQRTTSLDAYVSPRMRLALWTGAFVRLVADQRTEWVQIEQRGGSFSPSGDSVRTRTAAGVGAEVEQFLFDRRWLVVPGVRVDAIVNRFSVGPGEGELGDQGRDDHVLGWSPRLGTRLRVVPGLELRGSGGRYFRPPTLMELFGDQGYVVGNEGLRPETGHSLDGGIVLDRSWAGLHAYAQVAGFATWSRDLIQWVAAGLVARPENVAAARVRGLEASVVLAPTTRIVDLQANYTLLETEDRGGDPARAGQALPGRPRHEVFVRSSAGRVWWSGDTPVEPRIFYTVDVVAGTFLDPSGRHELPARAIQGLGAELHVAQRVHVALEIRNLLDVRTAFITRPVAGARTHQVPVSDFLGFPLPGRSVWATVRIEMGYLARNRASRRSNA